MIVLPPSAPFLPGVDLMGRGGVRCSPGAEYDAGSAKYEVWPVLPGSIWVPFKFAISLKAVELVLGEAGAVKMDLGELIELSLRASQRIFGFGGAYQARSILL